VSLGREHGIAAAGGNGCWVAGQVPFRGLMAAEQSHRQGKQTGNNLVAAVVGTVGGQSAELDR
jgi:hypothetical protein